MSPAACGGTNDMELVTMTDRPFPVAAEGQIFASTGGLRIFVLRV